MLEKITIITTFGLAILVAQQTPTAGPFTAAQAAAGRTAYQENCASCHLPDMAGRNEAPQLAGSNFMNTWGNRSTRDLVALIQTSMPPGNVGGLNPETYVDLAAFILAANGARPGQQPLTATTEVAIRTVATGQVPTNFLQGGRGPGAAQAGRGGGGRGPAAISGPMGLTVTGEVKNYVPVTDEMLTHPDPADWLMIRRNYQAWSYSPLTQIPRKTSVNCNSPGSGR